VWMRSVSTRRVALATPMAAAMPMVRGFAFVAMAMAMAMPRPSSPRAAWASTVSAVLSAPRAADDEDCRAGDGRWERSTAEFDGGWVGVDEDECECDDDEFAGE